MIYQGKSGNDEWCLAARRVILNSDYEGKNVWLYESKRSRQFLKDRATLWKWLRRMSVNKDPAPNVTVIVEQKSDSYYDSVDVRLYNDVVDPGSIVLPLIQFIPCLVKSPIRVKRDGNDVFDEVYNRQWFMDTTGYLKCF